MPAYSSDILEFRGILKWGEAFGKKTVGGVSLEGVHDVHGRRSQLLKQA